MLLSIYAVLFASFGVCADFRHSAIHSWFTLKIHTQPLLRPLGDVDEKQSTIFTFDALIFAENANPAWFLMNWWVVHRGKHFRYCCNARMKNGCNSAGLRYAGENINFHNAYAEQCLNPTTMQMKNLSNHPFCQQPCPQIIIFFEMLIVMENGMRGEMGKMF